MTQVSSINQLILVSTHKKNNKKENRNTWLFTATGTIFTDRKICAYDLLTCGNTDPRCDEYEGSAEKPKKQQNHNSELYIAVHKHDLKHPGPGCSFQNRD